MKVLSCFFTLFFPTWSALTVSTTFHCIIIFILINRALWVKIVLKNCVMKQQDLFLALNFLFIHQEVSHFPFIKSVSFCKGTCQYLFKVVGFLVNVCLKYTFSEICLGYLGPCSSLSPAAHMCCVKGYLSMNIMYLLHHSPLRIMYELRRLPAFGLQDMLAETGACYSCIQTCLSNPLNDPEPHWTLSPPSHDHPSWKISKRTDSIGCLLWDCCWF